ncbi:MAG TPA: succinate dehydrogenase, cytochrome b556 subunit [Steroidobacter sp.]|nr:succinate dehydrogenase, cytochrome b556 subunit [Steroidobacter sp.]
MNTTTKSARPLSPHLGIYRWQYTMALSILHRITGVALAIGLLLFAYWLTALASGAEAYADARAVFAHPLTRSALVGFSFAFFYHLLNGVRHLSWDAGYGLERKSARSSGWAAFLGAVVATLIFWLLVMNRLDGGAA